MGSYIPQQISQFLNNIASLHGTPSQDPAIPNDTEDDIPFILRFQNTSLASDSESDESDDELEMIGRFILPLRHAAAAAAARSRPSKKKSKSKKKKSNKAHQTKMEKESKGKGVSPVTSNTSMEDVHGNKTRLDSSSQEDQDSRWLIQKYFQQFNASWNAIKHGGEPQGIQAAKDPEVYPPIQHVQLAESSGGPSAGPSGHEPVKRAKKKRSHRSSFVEPSSDEQEHELGEADLRARIREIGKLGLSNRERDRMVQKLMTERYYRITQKLYENSESSEYEEEDENQDDDDDDDDKTADTQLNNDEYMTQVKKASYYNEKEGILGCQHYQRGCKIQCSTCHKWYTCRFCHDESEPHNLIRPATTTMMCMHCFTIQPAGQDCQHCGVSLATYFCKFCKLWDDDATKSIYHCADCGICRIGEGLGKDFFHCSTCNVCMSITLQNSHRCIEHSTECNCPICGDYLFTSTLPVVFMSCGHPIHESCFSHHTLTSYKCPTCSRSVVNMAARFRILDKEIEEQPMPEAYRGWRAIVICNDCFMKSNTPFHFLGLKCTNCGSYNTAQDKIVKPETGEDGVVRHIEVENVDANRVIELEEEREAIQEREEEQEDAPIRLLHF